MRFIFLIHLKNNLSHSLVVGDWITGLSCLTTYKCSCDVSQALGVIFLEGIYYGFALLSFQIHSLILLCQIEDNDLLLLT